MRAAVRLVAVGMFAVAAPLAAQDSLPPVAVPEITMPAPAPGQPTGRIAGIVIDRETGRPIPGIRVRISMAVPVETDLDGRYRSLPLLPRTYTVRVQQIGYQVAQIDSVVVTASRTTAADFALQALTVTVEGITVEAAAVTSPSSEASLLALQQSAASVSDGISAEAISRSPDADAADAISRVTGISVVDDKFVVVRGLPERYNSTLLNGAELSSPDPNRRVVPLDIFPASLLESIVATKTATPDRPGDFAGGMVEIRTREFPAEDVLQVNAATGYNSLATFDRLPVPRRSGWDVLGFDSRRRAPDVTLRGERFAESFRNVWTPAPGSAPPDTRFGVSLGGQRDLGGAPLGGALAFTYSSDVRHAPDRFFSVFSGPPDSFPADRSLLYEETRAAVDWGAVANFSLRPGRLHKLSWRNLVTRNAEESNLLASGYDTENSRVNQQYQVRYVEQTFYQAQLAGEHQLPWLFGSQVEWRGTLGSARRHEPENRQAYYQFTGGTSYVLLANQPTFLWVRDLRDRIVSTQLDWSVPFRLRSPGDALFKFGGSYRRRARDASASAYTLTLDNTAPNAQEIAALPPEQAFAPENVGSALKLESEGVRAQPYTASDQVAAGYAMLDLFLLRGVRLVGGARYEAWTLEITPLAARPGVLRQPDLLWSGNMTIAAGSRTNLRLAAFRSVTRPDARERTADVALPVVGACEVSGDTALQRAVALNFDARFEFYRRPGEIASVSAFYKRFDRPIVETIGVPGGGNCRATTRNAAAAENLGVELELRREVLLPGLLAGVNLTVVDSRVTMPALLGTYDSGLPLAGQSPLLVNVSVAYRPPAGRLQGSLLFNYFSDRVIRYGLASTTGGVQNPNLYERGRAQLDAKVQWALHPRATLSLSGRNLTNATTSFFHPTASGEVRSGFERSGVSFSFGVGYDR